MAPVATESTTKPNVADLKASNGKIKGFESQVFNPFYSPGPSDNLTAEEYEYAKYIVRWVLS